ncbi:twin-arginine translocase TatA/TatE family subunit [Alicyclobacillaceae bacterium I2511]|jgi:sec-independent protein translocase protein TatA|nr:twin-arginine translocase TatA/TatE family subunit [Alicyclobacillaceae bacterium I2511]
MGFGNIGWSGLLLIFFMAFLVFGPSRLPELAKSIGKSLQEFRKASKGLLSENEPPQTECPITEPPLNSTAAELSKPVQKD